jgi:phosphatidylserine/phosphatidylglycerophosphate/cardiolipin synthase-like enzyme
MARRLYPRPGAHRVQVVRTMPWLGELGVRDMFGRAFAQARDLVYVENQYAFQSTWATRQAIAALSRRPSLRMIVVLPLWPDLLPLPMPGLPDRLDLRANLGELFVRFGERVAVLGLLVDGAAPGEYASVYCHSKLMIVDDTWLTIGSANLDDGSLESHTELNLSVLDSPSARGLRRALLTEHLGGMFDPALLDDSAALFARVREATRATAAAVTNGRRLPARFYEFFWDRLGMPRPPPHGE